MRIGLLISCVLSSLSVLAQKTDTLLSGVYSWNRLDPQKEDTRVRRQILEGKTFALSDLEVHASTLEPGKAPDPPHVHNDQ